jgi:hypothetical protein
VARLLHLAAAWGAAALLLGAVAVLLAAALVARALALACGPGREA